MAQGDTAFPWMVQLSFRNTTFRSLVIFVATLDSAVYRNQARLGSAAYFGQKFVQMYIFPSHPTTVEPKDIEATVFSHQLLQLVVSEVLIVLPPIRMTFLLVVDVTVRSIKFRIPKPFAMPVRLREVTTHHETFLAESIPYVTGHVLTRVVLERTVGDGVIGIFRIEHTETIVMLGGENHVLHTGFIHDACPLVRIKVCRIEFIDQTPIPFLKIIIIRDPAYQPVFRAKFPRLNDTSLRIKSPVEQYPELLVLPLVKFFQHGLVCRPFIGVRTSVYEAVLLLSLRIHIQA